MLTLSDFTYDLIADEGDDFDSTAIDIVAYNRETKELFIQFKSGGEYVYNGVEESTYNVFVSAPSLGRFYQNHISGKFTSTKGDWLVFERVGGYEDVDFSGQEEPVDFVPGEQVNPTAHDWWTTFWAGVKENTASEPVVAKWGIKWNASDVPGPFEYEVDATSELDAVRKFNENVQQAIDFLGADALNDAKILSVTHYFE